MINVTICDHFTSVDAAQVALRPTAAATMIDAFTEAAREQPADNLTLLSARPPARTRPRSDTGCGPIEGDDARLCNAAATRGRGCTHPKPRPGGNCPAGHRHPA